jgi:hypothetical protein
MFAVDDRGRSFRGFFAFRRIAWETPLLWLAIPLMYFPGAGIAGPHAYAWIARNRHRFGCESEVCALPSGGTDTSGSGDYSRSFPVVKSSPRS